MLVTIPTFRSKPAGMDRDSTIRPIVRKTVALSKSLGPICDLVSTGAVAIYVVGVYFGVGFYLLMLKDTEGSRFGTGSDHLSKSLTETSHAFQSMIGPDRLIIQLPNYDDAWKIGVLVAFAAGIVQIVAGGPVHPREARAEPQLVST